MKFLKVVFPLFALSGAPLFSAVAETAGLVSIEGNRLIESALILPHIQLKAGGPFSEKRVQEDVHRLFSLGFFEDIQARRKPSPKGLHVVYHLKERAHINKVTFEGNEQIATQDLEEMSLIKPHSFLNFKHLKQTFEAIKKAYIEKGFYLAQVSYKLKTSQDQGAQLIIQIQEGKKLLIKQIQFIGNRSIPSEDLKAFMLTKERGLLSFLGSSGIYQKKLIERDQQALEYYYRDQGYLNVRVDQPTIAITPDDRYLYITFPIVEGGRFKMGRIAFEGDEEVPSDTALKLLQLKDQEYFSLSKMHADMRAIASLYKDKGYAFAKVQPSFFPDPLEEDKIHILFRAEKGSVYKIRRVRVEGNQSTRDKVILRLVNLQEGELFSESKKNLSQSLLRQLGYFEKIDISPDPETASNGELDLLVRVKERENTGEAIGALGYNGEYIFVRGGVKKQNFLGLGQNLSLNLNLSRYDEIAVFSWQNPYFMDSEWNFELDVFNASQGYLGGSGSRFGGASGFMPETNSWLSYYRLDTGFSLSFGRKATKFSSLFLKYQLQKQQLSGDGSIYFLRNLPVVDTVFEALFGSKEAGEGMDLPGSFSDIYNFDEARGLNSSLAIIGEYDTRNDRYYTTGGLFARLSLEYSGLAGDFDYSKIEGQIRHWHSPFWKLVIKNRLEYGLVFSNSSKKPVPFTQLFLLGGSDNLRGVSFRSQGPRKKSQKALAYAEKNQEKLKKEFGGSFEPQAFSLIPYGGEQMFFYSLELEFPIIESAQLRGAFFFDAGEANNQLSLDWKDQLRMSAGLGIRWKSPFAPISLDWAFPARPRKSRGESDYEFHFRLGSAF